MEGHLVMSAKERRRKVEFECIRKGGQTIKDAAARLELSYRHCRRSYKRFCGQGDIGLVHRGRGRPSNRSKPEAFKEAVLSRYRERYKGFGPVLAMEKLAEEGYVLGRETLRRWLIEAGLWEPCRRTAHHRSWRERRGHFGELVQMDGSHHQWFEDGKAMNCLMNMVDDATGTTLALMGEQETTELAMRALRQWCECYGTPRALYTDKKNVFVTTREPTIEEQLAGQQPLSAFGKVCAKLDIEIITANSPQAKGRVERKHGVFQDRFVKELKLQSITTITEANTLLKNGFVDTLNRKFACPPRNEIDFHRPAPTQRELREIFCFEQTRVVSNDWTVRCENRLYQIQKRNTPVPRRGDKVIVRRLLDGTIQLLYRDKKLRFNEIAQHAAPNWHQGLRAAAKRTRPT